LKDYYKILQIGFNTDAREIKRAYRKLALSYHPDKNSSVNAMGKFIEATEAYEVLSDSEKRRKYDQIYKSKISAPQTIIYEHNEYHFHFNEWATYGKEKAGHYSSMDYKHFAKRLKIEAKSIFDLIGGLLVSFVLFCMMYGLFMMLFLGYSSIKIGYLLLFFALFCLITYINIAYTKSLFSEYKTDRSNSI